MFRIGMPPDWSLDGHYINSLLGLANGLVFIYFVAVSVTLVALIVLFRRRKGRKAAYFDGTRPGDLWLTFSLAALVFISVDINLELHSESHLREHFFNFPKPEQALRIEIMPQQWAWNIRYAGPDGKFGTDDDVVTLNDLRIPTHQPVLIQLQAKDVIHSFTLPYYRLKVDANPGSINQAWFQAEQEGISEIACSQMCGWAHFQMRGEVTAMDPKSFESWMREAAANAKIGHDAADKFAQWGWDWKDE